MNGDPLLPTGVDETRGSNVALPWIVLGVAAAGVLGFWALRQAAFAVAPKPVSARKSRRK